LGSDGESCKAVRSHAHWRRGISKFLGTKRSEGLGLLATVTFAVGNMIGAGVFVLSGIVVDAAGPAAILSYLICGGIVVASGLSYAMLASIFPKDGGGYLYVRSMLGKYPGFLTGWGMYIFSVIASAFVLIGFGIYLNLLLGTSIDPRVFAVIGLIALTLLNLRGLAEAGFAEIILVLVKMAILISLVLVGLIHFGSIEWVPFTPNGSSGVLLGVVMVFFAYSGFQVAAMMGGEVRKSSKMVPIAIISSILIVMVIYVGIIVALLAANLPSYGSNSVFEAATILIGPAGAVIVAIGAVISTLTSVNAGIVGSSRITMEMASEGELPGRFAALRRGSPANSIFLGSIITLIFVLYGNLNFLIDVANVCVLVTMVLVNIAALVLSRNRSKVPSDRKYFRFPFARTITLFGALSCFVMILFLPPYIILFGLLLLLSGSVLYFLEDTPSGKQAIVEIRRELKKSEIKR
jgi:basic amino acid/polyamine antiporter, APA family